MTKSERGGCEEKGKRTPTRDTQVRVAATPTIYTATIPGTGRKTRGLTPQYALFRVCTAPDFEKETKELDKIPHFSLTQNHRRRKIKYYFTSTLEWNLAEKGRRSKTGLE